MTIPSVHRNTCSRAWVSAQGGKQTTAAAPGTGMRCGALQDIETCGLDSCSLGRCGFGCTGVAACTYGPPARARAEPALRWPTPPCACFQRCSRRDDGTTVCAGTHQVLPVEPWRRVGVILFPLLYGIRLSGPAGQRGCTAGAGGAAWAKALLGGGGTARGLEAGRPLRCPMRA